MVAIADGKPQQMGLLDIIACYTNYQRDVVYNRTKFQLKKAKERAHILEGLIIAIKNIDEVVAIIKKSQSTSEARQNLGGASGAADAAQQSGGAGISHLRQASHGGRGRGNDADRPQSARRPVRICPAGNAAAGGNCGKSRPQALRH